MTVTACRTQFQIMATDPLCECRCRSLKPSLILPPTLMYVFQIPRSNDFNAIRKTRHVIVLALRLVLVAPGIPSSWFSSPTHKSSPAFSCTSQFSFSQQVRLLQLLGLGKETEVDFSLKKSTEDRTQLGCQVALPGPAWLDYTS